MTPNILNRFVLLVTLNGLGLYGCAQDYVSSDMNMDADIKPIAWLLKKDLCDPETVVYSDIRDELYVSNICSYERNGKGYISRISLKGDMIESEWIQNLNAPAGMALVGQRLFVADIDRVHIFDEVNGQLIETRGPFEAAGAFNDIAVDANGTVYVSDSARAQLFTVTSETIVAFPNESERFESANGLLVDDTTLYVGGEDGIFVLDLTAGIDAQPQKYETDLFDIDGIESDGDGGLVVSQVGGDIWHLPKNGPRKRWTTQTLSSTNHLYLPQYKRVIVPTGFDNSVIAFSH